MVKLLKTLTPLSEQALNSFWTFICLRMIYSVSSEFETALMGLVILFSYTCSGLLRSKYINPLYGDSEISNKEISILSYVSKNLVLIITGFLIIPFVYLEFLSSLNSREIIVLLIVVFSIIILDFLRSFLQINGEFYFSILLNFVGIILVSFLDHRINETNNFKNLTEIWAFVNCLVILLALVIGSISKKSFISKETKFIVHQKKNSNLSRLTIAEFSFSRILNLLGQGILLQLNESAASDLILALFVFTTIPFSVINGLSPVYLKNRNSKVSKLKLSTFFTYVALAAVFIPVALNFTPNLVKLFFGTKNDFDLVLILFVICLVAQKAYDSAKSIDMMMSVSMINYLCIKLIISILISILCPIYLSQGEPLIALIIATIVFSGQILIFEKSFK